MNVFVFTAEGFPAEIRDRVVDRLREKHPSARVQRLDAGKADRILCFGPEPDFVRFFRKSGTPTVVYAEDGTHVQYDERLFEALLVSELHAYEVSHDWRGRRVAGGSGFDERRNTSRVFGVAPGAAEDAVEVSRAWQAERAEREAAADDGQLAIDEAA